MTNDELDRLSKLASLLELCAKMGGTPLFVRVQRMINEDLIELIDKLDPPSQPKKVIVQPVARPTETIIEPVVIEGADQPEHIDRRV